MDRVLKLHLLGLVSGLSYLQVVLTQPKHIARHGMESVTEALAFVQEIASQPVGNCTIGLTLDLDYEKKRWSTEADVAVRSANLLTLLSRTGFETSGIYEDEYLLYAIVIGNVDSNSNVFGAGIAFDAFIYKNLYLFLPYAYRRPDGSTEAKDVAASLDYQEEHGEWFHYLIQKNKNVTFDSNYSFYRDPSGENSSELRLQIRDGYWSKPYFDCGGGNVWMVTFSMPFFVGGIQESKNAQSQKLKLG